MEKDHFSNKFEWINLLLVFFCYTIQISENLQKRRILTESPTQSELIIFNDRPVLK